jgi:N6-L-threonylcarbamoyladenine synthase
LKTAILQLSSKIKTEKDKENLAASFQKTINEILYVKCKSAMTEFFSKYKNNKKVFVISGGVASNKSIRNNLDKLSKEMGFENFFPPIELCSDNGAMIAWAGIERFKKGMEDIIHFKKSLIYIDKFGFVLTRTPLKNRKKFI